MENTTLGEIGNVLMCKRILKEQTSEKGEIPFFKISTFGGKADTFISRDLFEEYKEKFSYPKKGDILISAAGTIGKTVVFNGDESYFQDSNIVWLDNDESIVLNQYLYYFYQTKPWITTNGSIISRLYNSDIKSIKIHYPNLKTQHQIAQILSTLDRKIALNQQINAQLEKMAKTLYDYWFVQFDFPDELGRPYQSSGGEMVWNEVLKREVPKGWGVTTLADIANITMGQSPNGESYNENGQGVIFFQGSTDFNWRYPTIRQYTTQPTRMAKKGDILLSVRAPVGTMNLTNFECCIGRGLAALNSKNNANSFLFYVMKNLEKEFNLRNSMGTTFGSITKDDLFSLKIIMPDKNIIQEFEKIVSKYNEIISKQSIENDTLTHYRDFLLPMLMNGQVGVS